MGFSKNRNTSSSSSGQRTASRRQTAVILDVLLRFVNAEDGQSHSKFAEKEVFRGSLKYDFLFDIASEAAKAFANDEIDFFVNVNYKKLNFIVYKILYM